MSDFRFSANLGFLWRDLPFVRRIEKAAECAFDAVEFHDEAQHHDLDAVCRVLKEHNLPVVSINTTKGEVFGSAAVPERQEEAHAVIHEAITTAERLDAHAIHVLAGCTESEAAHRTFLANLIYALENTKKTILIEPISEVAVPGYFLSTLGQAEQVLNELSHPRLKIMFDCFHIRNTTSQVEAVFRKVMPLVGHVQIASYPDRREPFDDDITYSRLLPAMRSAGYNGYFGCEYIPEVSEEDGLHWRRTFKG